MDVTCVIDDVDTTASIVYEPELAEKFPPCESMPIWSCNAPCGTVSVADAPTFPTTGGTPPVVWATMFPLRSVNANTTVTGDTIKLPGYPAEDGWEAPGAVPGVPLTVAVPVTVKVTVEPTTGVEIVAGYGGWVSVPEYG